MNGKEAGVRTPDDQAQVSSPGSQRTYRRWRMLTFVIAAAFLITPVLFLLYLWLRRLYG